MLFLANEVNYNLLFMMHYPTAHAKQINTLHMIGKTIINYSYSNVTNCNWHTRVLKNNIRNYQRASCIRSSQTRTHARIGLLARLYVPSLIRTNKSTEARMHEHTHTHTHTPYTDTYTHQQLYRIIDCE